MGTMVSSASCVMTSSRQTEVGISSTTTYSVPSMRRVALTRRGVMMSPSLAREEKMQAICRGEMSSSPWPWPVPARSWRFS